MKLLITILLLTISLTLFAGGPWLHQKKSGFFQIQTTLPIGTYNKLFLENNKDITINRAASDYNFQAYLEYGLTNKLNIIASLPYKYIATKDKQDKLTNSTLLPEGNLSGFSNHKVAIKYKLLDKKIKAAVSLQSSLYSNTSDLKKGLSTGYSANSLGLGIHVGKSFSENLYSFIEAGYHNSSHNFSDFFTFSYELGYQLKPKLWTSLFIDIRESFKNGSYQNENLQQTGFYTNNQEYFAYGIKASYELKNKFGFTAATFGAFSGNYVAHLATVSLGVYKKW